MIPVLGVPVLSGPDHLKRMLESVDTDTTQVVIVDNGDVVPEDFSMTPFCHVIRLPHNIGCGAGWNLIMKVTPKAPWWFLTNHDIIFAPGDLEKIARAMWAAGEEERPLLAMLSGFSAFALNQRVLKAVGYFDENLHPAYFEDNDYGRRCVLAGVPIVDMPGESTHVGSATIYESKRYRNRNFETFAVNRDYYKAKWGGMPGQEIFTRPFNGDADIRDVAIDPDRLRDLAWERVGS